MNDAGAVSGTADRRPTDAINALFGMLHQIERFGPTAKVLVRRRGGQIVGTFRLVEGRLCRIAGLGDHRPLTERLQDALTPADDDTAFPPVGLLRRGSWDEALFEVRPDEQAVLRHLLRRQLADEALALAELTGRDRPDLVRISLSESTRRHFPGSTPLEVFLEVARGLDVQPEDAASEFFRRCESHASAAVLLLRPQEGGTVPIPVALRGFERAGLNDVLPLCVGTLEMCRPTQLAQVGMEPDEVSIPPVPGQACWVCVSGESRLAAVRFASFADLSRVLHGAGPTEAPPPYAVPALAETDEALLERTLSAVPDCTAAAWLDLSTGKVTSLRLAAPAPDAGSEWAFAVPPELFETPHAVAVERLYRQSHPGPDDSPPYLREIAVRWGGLLHVFVRPRRNGRQAVVLLCRGTADVGQVLAAVRRTLPPA